MKLNDAIKVSNLDFASGTQATVADSRSADEWIKKWLDEKNKRQNDLRVSLHKLLDHPPTLDEYLRPEMKAAFRVDKPPIYEQKPGRVASGGRWAVVSQEGEIISTWQTEEEAKKAAKPYWRGLLPSASGPTGTAQVKYIAAGGPGSGCQGPNCGRPKAQGKVVAERQDDGSYLVMFPNGDIAHAPTKQHAENKAKRWFKRDLGKGAVGVGAIEWRGEDIDAADIFVDQELQDRTRSKQKVLQHPKPQVVKDADQLRMGDRRPSSVGQGSAGTGGAGAGGAGGGTGI